MGTAGRVYVQIPTTLRDTTKAFLVFSTTLNGSNISSKVNVAGQILGDDTLVFVRNDNSNSNNNTISWEIYEFASGVTVQRGSVNTATNPTNVTLPNAVDLSKSFAISTAQRGGTAYGTDDANTATLTTSTNLQLDFGTGSVLDSAFWQVIQYNDCFVQQVATTLTAGSASTTSSIPTAVTANKTMVISNFRVQGDISAGDVPRTELTNGTTLTFTRGGGTAQNINLLSYVVQFTDSTLVTRATQNFASGVGTVNVTLSPPVDTSVTGVIAPGHMNRGGTTSYTTDDAMGYCYFVAQLTSTTNLKLWRRDSTATTADFPYQLVAFSKNDHAARNYSTTITFNTTATGANVPSNQTNFPVLVRLDANNFLFTQAEPDGSDIRFADPDGSSLKYQIERWDATNKVAEVWVLVPQVDGNSAQDYITMYWGNNLAMSASRPNAVFDTTNNFRGVWHFSGNSFSDATYHANNGTNVSSTNATGLIGEARQFTAASHQAVTVPYAASLGQNTFTVSLWANMTSYQTDNGLVSSRFGASDYSFDFKWNANKLHGDIGTNSSWLTTAADYTVNPGLSRWYNIVYEATVNSYKVYLDGALVNNGTIAGTPILISSGNTLYIGRSGYSVVNEYFDGYIDEVEVSSVQRSADWVKLQYENQRSNGKFLSFPNTALSTFTYSNKIYVNTTPSGANISTNQTNYPLLVRLNSANFNFSQARSDGGDLRFADSTGSLLSYEIERFDATNKAAEIWVLVPTIYANNNSQWLRMYWGKSTATSLSSGSAVFLATGNYVAVYHLAEDGSTTASAYKDASAYGNNGTGVALTNASDVAADVGIGSNFTSASNQGITAPYAANLHPSGSLTIQAWINTTSQGTFKRIVGRPFTSVASPYNEYDLELDGSSNHVSFSLTVGGTEASYQTTTALTNGTWAMVAGVYDGATQKVYHNGVQEASSSRTGAISDYQQGLSIGKYGLDNNSNFDGKIDEVRISMTARSADWLKLDYETMKATSTVVTVGYRQADYAASTRFNFNTTATGANVTGTDVTNIPILVRLSSANIDFTKTNANGSDIQFIDKDGTYLYHEVVEWDKANTTGKVWVKVPQVDKNSTTDYITLYYGCSTCTGSPYALKDSVWSGYNAVYHLNGSDAQAYDATPNANHGTFTAEMPTSSGITTALSPFLDGTKNQIVIPNSNQLDGETTTSSFWIKTSAVGTSATWYSSLWLLDRDTFGPGNAGWAVTLANGNGKINFVTVDDVLTSNTDIGNGSWHRLDLVKTTSNKYIYIDGVIDNSKADAGVISNDENIYLGGQDGTGFYTASQWNEFSIAPTNRSADFIKLSYENQKANSTLFSATTFTTASFQRNKVYKFNTTASGANVSGDVYNFPVLIRVTGTGSGSATSITDLCQSAGQDIRFLDADGVTWLDYSIERWSQSADSGEVWVKIPKIPGNSASGFITMYYQQASGVTIPDGQCESCVFNSKNGFVGVWHLNTSGTGARPNSVSGGNNATTVNYDNNEFTGGVIAGADSLDGGSPGDYLDLGSGYADFTNGITYSVWAYPTSAANWSRFLDLGNGQTSDNIILSRNGTGTDVANDLYLSGNKDGWITSSTASIALNSWQHFTMTLDNSKNMKVYQNGALVGTGTMATYLKNITRNNCYIGKSNWPDAYYQGRIDEPELANVARDANWIKLAYQNQRRDATPLFNPSPADFVSSRKYVFNTTKTGAGVMNNVTNYPLLVRITGSTIVDAVQNNAPDIRFLDGDGKTWLNYQIERWDKALDSAEVWVSVPQVDGNSDHDFITLYYDDVSNGAIADGQCAACVFDTSLGIASAWHLNNSLSDITINANNGTNQGSVDGEGVASSGRSFSGTAQYATFGNGNSLKNISNAITVEAWIKTSLSAASSPISVLRYDGKYTALQYTNGANTARTALWNTGLTLPSYTWNGQFDDNAWHHYVSQYDASQGIKIYRDGILYASSGAITGALATNNTNNFTLGGTEGGAELWTGKLDEVRVYRAFQDSNWIKLDYQSQRRTGNVFWNSRPGPDNLVTLTATAGINNIALSWNTPVSDSSNADSVGIWVKYTGYPDSAGAASTTRVVQLPKTDSTYTYPATYPGTYYFALAVRNASGVWSPFTSTSSDTAVLGGSATWTDTVYVDSAIGNNSNTCTQARSPFTPLKNFRAANGCESNNITDTLVVRAMPGTYTDSVFDSNVKPIVYSSFDVNSRAVMNGSGTKVLDGGTRNFTVLAYGGAHIRNLDIKCSVNGNSGIYLTNEAGNTIDGNRIYNSGNLKHDKGLEILGAANDKHISNNLIYQPTTYGIYSEADNSYNIVNNTLIGSGSAGTKGIYVNVAAFAADATLSNNILCNWDYGIQTTSANIGVCSNNMFYGVTSGREVTGTTDANKVIKDPLFANNNPSDRNGFKLLPGSPAIDAGTASYGSGAQACAIRTNHDAFGSVRPQGTAPDIGLYEGTGYTANPSGEFDTLQTSTTATTVTVKNSKWKIIFDQTRGGGINFFSDMSDSTTNLLASSSLLFDAKFDAYQASSATSGIPPVFLERTRARAVVRQWLAVSTSLNVNIYYTIYPSGHIYVQSEISNIANGTTAIGTVDYTLKLGTTTNAAYVSGGSKNGFGYLTTSTRDAMLSVTKDLDGAGMFSETWSTATAAAGPPGTVVFKTTDLADLTVNMQRRHNFLLYIGDANLDYQKSATLNADAYNPSVITASSGSLLLERSWQDILNGHWAMDDGAGATVRDKAVYYQNNASISGAGAKWVSGKVGGGLYLTATDVAVVTSTVRVDAFLGGTYMFWIKPDFSGMGNTGFILSKGLTTSDGWYFRKVAGQNQITFNMGAASATTPTLTDGVWTHICAVVKPGGFKQINLYVNGTQVASSTGAATAVANSTDLHFGENAGGGATDRFQGTLDDIRIFNNEIYPYDIQAVATSGFSARYGHYALRADNNNRIVALINGNAPQTRIQPVFQISNWSGPKTPKYVYLNGTRLKPNSDFAVDSVGNAIYGAYLVLQLNKTLTAADQTLFIDDDDSTGYMGDGSKMKSLTMAATANDKLVIKNFSDTVFSGASSGQWYLELDLNGWTSWNSARVVDTGFGEFNVWKAAAVNPNVAISSSTNQVGIDPNSGRSLSHLKFDNTTSTTFSGGAGYLGPGNITYTLTDSSSTRLSLVLGNMSMQGPDGTFTLSKRFTVYPSGRIFASYVISSLNFNMDDPDFDIQTRYNNGPTTCWGTTYANTNARWGWMGGDLSFHSVAGGLLSIKNNTAVYSSGATMLRGTSNSLNGNTNGEDYRRARLSLTTALFTSANATPTPITVNYMLDISRDFTDSATADSLIKDVQTPAVLTAISGSRTTNDALDYNGDNFAEGDGAYTYAAASGLAHFKFVNSVASFSPAFRISSWTFGTLPEFVEVDNQVLAKGYQYNAYINTATSELIIQFNRTYAAGTHVFYISHKNGLAVTLRRFEAKGGEGVDTLKWTTESEFENLGYHVYRRIASAEGQLDTALVDGGKVAGAGISNALMEAAQSQAAAKNAAKNAAKTVAAADSAAATEDTLISQSLTSQELAAMGYERIDAKLIPGAKGGASATTQDYAFIDRTAAFGVTYEYLLEATDFNGTRTQYGPRTARPENPLLTELYPNYPNPFNPITTLHFSLKEAAKVSLIIYDSKGKAVRTLLRPTKAMPAGKYRLIWDAKNEAGLGVPSGQYFYRFTAPHYNKTRKMVYVK